MTRAGLGALVAGSVLTAAGLVLRWPALAVLGAGTLMLLAAGLAWIAHPPRVRLERQVHPTRVPKGVPAIAYLQVANTGRSRLPVTVARQPYGDGVVRAVLPELRPGEQGVRTYRLPTARRGVYDLGPVEVERGDPFGLLRVVRRFGGTERLWVHPRLLPLLPLPSGVTRNLDGPSSDTAPEGDITFHRLREYVDGDDLRMVHWRSTARTGRLMVRHNVDTSQPYTVVLLDLDPSVHSADSFETAVDVAASVVVASARDNAAVQLCASTGARVGGPGGAAAQQAVDWLTEVAPDPAGDVARELRRLRSHRGGTGLVVVTGALADRPAAPAVGEERRARGEREPGTDAPRRPDWLQGLPSLRRRFRRVVLVSIAEATGPPVRLPGVTVVQAGDGDAFAAAWHLQVRRPAAVPGPAAAGHAPGAPGTGGR